MTLDPRWTPSQDLLDTELKDALARRDAALREYEHHRQFNPSHLPEHLKGLLQTARERACERYLAAGQEYRQLLDLCTFTKERGW